MSKKQKEANLKNDVMMFRAQRLYLPFSAYNFSTKNIPAQFRASPDEWFQEKQNGTFYTSSDKGVHVNQATVQPINKQEGVTQISCVEDWDGQLSGQPLNYLLLSRIILLFYMEIQTKSNKFCRNIEVEGKG